LSSSPRESGSTVCRYLGPFGCSIHAKRPVICREFDCRELAPRQDNIKARLKSVGRMDQYAQMKPLIERGRELLEQEKKA
jgi:Fe-S-cluster containining protein